jgi:hypothetical protein
MHTGAEPPKHPALSIEIEHALVAALRPEARRRDVSVARLVYDLLGMIAADGLVTAILDDDHPLPARRGAGR